MVEEESGLFERRVRAHSDFVYSAAMRQTRGDGHLAQDVTQAVFILLAERGTTIRDNQLAGWLFNTTRYMAHNALRREARRRRHEKQAGMEQAMRANTASNQEQWDQIRPYLDAAIASLGKGERDVVLLHYFHGSPLQDVATTLGISELATRQRASRAVQRLRKFFAGRGILAAGLGELFANHALETAPKGLVDAIASGAGSTTWTRAGELIKWTNGMKFLAMVKWVAAVIFGATALVLVAQSVKHGHETEQSDAAPLPATPLPASMPAIPSIKPATTGTGTRLSPPDLSDVVSIRQEVSSNFPGQEGTRITWTDASQGNIETARRTKLPGGDYVEINIDGEQWRWQDGAGTAGHFFRGKLWEIGSLREKRWLTNWVQADLVRTPKLDATIDGEACSAYRQVDAAGTSHVQTMTTYFWADNKNRMRKESERQGGNVTDVVVGYNPPDLKTAFTPPSVPFMDLEGLLLREYPIEGAEIKNAEGLAVALHQIKRDPTGRFLVLLSVRAESPDPHFPAAKVPVGQYTIRLEGGYPIATLWDQGAGVIYGVIPESAGANGLCKFEVGLAKNAGIDSPQTRVEFAATSQGDQSIDDFAGNAYDAAARLTPLMGGAGSGIFKVVQIDGSTVRYPLPPPMIGRAEFIASLRAPQATK